MNIDTEDTIDESLVAEIIALTDLTDLHDGGRLVRILRAVGRRLARVQDSVWDQRDSFLLGTATQDADIDARGADVLPDGLGRLPGQYALGGAFAFTRPAGQATNIVIPAGTPVLRGTDKFPYRTTADAVLAPNATASSPVWPAITVSVVAGQIGAIGNCASGAINALGAPIEGVTGCQNAAPLANGLDAETGSAFKDRIRATIRSYGLGPNAALILACQAIQDPTLGQILFASLGAAEATAGGGYVPLYVDDGAGSAGPVVTGATSTLIASASGVERTLYGSVGPLLPGAYGLQRNGVAWPPAGAWACVEPWCQFRLAGVLTAGDVVEVAAYSAYGGLVALAQRVVDGIMADPIGTPGKRGVGNVVRVLPAAVVTVGITGSLVFRAGYDPATWRPQLNDQAAAFLNGLGIGAPVIGAQVEQMLMDSGTLDNVRGLLIDSTTDLYVAEHAVVRSGAMGLL